MQNLGWENFLWTGLSAFMLVAVGCAGSTEKGADIAMQDVQIEAGQPSDSVPDEGIRPPLDLVMDTASDCPGDMQQETSPDSKADSNQPPAMPPYETMAFTTVHNCVGCQGVSICGWPPMSDSYGITMDAAPNEQTGVLFAAERWEAAGRKLPLETCQALTGETLEPVAHPPQGVDVLDAGTLVFSGTMPLLAQSVSLEYQNITGNYPSAYRASESPESWPAEYNPGSLLSLDSGGGADWSGFSLADNAPEPIIIVTPSTDKFGQIQSIPTDQALEVTWTGADSYADMVISLEGFFCDGGVEGIRFIVVCHAHNDGAFTVPGELLSSLEFPMHVNLGLSISRKVALTVPETDGAPAWSVRTWADVPVYHDPNASPVQDLECTGADMVEGFAGEPCTSDDDCGGGCCLPEYQVYFHDNYCSVPDCSGDEDCPSDAVCAMDPWATPWDSYCAAICETDGDCRFPDYACLLVESGKTACKPNFW